MAKSPIDTDKDAWMVQIWLKPAVKGQKENRSVSHVQLTPEEAFGSFPESLKSLRKQGKILDFQLRHIPRFDSGKKFIKDLRRELK